MQPASSAAVITIPSRSQAIAIGVVLQRIRQLLDACGTSNRHDLAIVAIEALIEEGVDTGPSIIDAGRSLGFDRRHVGAILANGRGSNPARHRWERSENGVYRLHAAEAAA